METATRGKPDLHLISQIAAILLVLYPVITIVIGFQITPKEKYQDDFMEGMTPFFVYGFAGAVAAVVALVGTVVTLRSPRIQKWHLAIRAFLRILILVGSFAAGIGCGWAYMMNRHPRPFTLPFRSPNYFNCAGALSATPTLG